MFKRLIGIFTMVVVTASISGPVATADGELYNVAYRAEVTVSGVASATDIQYKEWRMVNGIKGNTSAHDFFQTQALTDVTSQFFIFLDLGDVYPVSRVALTGGNSAYIKTFNLQVSEDNLEWNSFGETGTGFSGYTTVTINAAIADARYVKILAVESNSTTPAVSEIEVFSTKPKLNVLRGAAAVFENAAVNGTNYASKAVDGIASYQTTTSATTYIHTDGNYGTETGKISQAQTTATATDAWKLKTTLTERAIIEKIVLVPGKSNYPTQYTIEVSQNGEEWATAPSAVQAAGTGNFVPAVYQLSSPVEASHIRVNVTASNGANPSISEIEAFGVPIADDTAKTLNMQIGKVISHSIPVVADRGIEYINNGVAGTVDPALNDFAQFRVADEGAESESYQYISWNVILDLGRDLNITDIAVVPGKSLYVKQFKLYTSVESDGENFAERAFEQNGRNNYEKMNYNVGKIKVRYVKFEALENSHWTPCISELIVENNDNVSQSIFNPQTAEADGFVFKDVQGTFPSADPAPAHYFIAQQGKYGKISLDGNNFIYTANEPDAPTSFTDTVKIGADDGSGDYHTHDIHFNMKNIFSKDAIVIERSESESDTITCTYTYNTDDMDIFGLDKELVFAIYQNSRLVGVAISKTPVEDGANSKLVAAVSGVQTSKTYTAKAFLWNEIRTLKPYISKTQLLAEE